MLSGDRNITYETVTLDSASHRRKRQERQELRKVKILPAPLYTLCAAPLRALDIRRTCRYAMTKSGNVCVDRLRFQQLGCLGLPTLYGTTMYRSALASVDHRSICPGHSTNANRVTMHELDRATLRYTLAAGYLKYIILRCLCSQPKVTAVKERLYVSIKPSSLAAIPYHGRVGQKLASDLTCLDRSCPSFSHPNTSAAGDCLVTVMVIVM